LLELPESKLNDIAVAKKQLSHDEYQYQCACCAAMLYEWLENCSDHITTDHFIKILEYPLVGLSSTDITKLKSAMKSGSELTIMESASLLLCDTKPPKAPTELESKFAKMIFNVLKLLRNSPKDFNDALLNYLLHQDCLLAY